MSSLKNKKGLQLFVTGTDTGVGKTYFTSWLIKCWRAHGFQAAGLKPIACGDRRDARKLCLAADREISLDRVNPIYFKAPMAPLAAARLESRRLPLKQIERAVAVERKVWPWLAVEGVGGWRVPLTPKAFVSDWAVSLRLPVLVVARAGLGTINHTLLTVESILSSGAHCYGIVLNPGGGKGDRTTDSNATFLERATGLPVWHWTKNEMRKNILPPWLKHAVTCECCHAS